MPATELLADRNAYGGFVFRCKPGKEQARLLRLKRSRFPTHSNQHSVFAFLIQRIIGELWTSGRIGKQEPGNYE